MQQWLQSSGDTIFVLLLKSEFIIAACDPVMKQCSSMVRILCMGLSQIIQSEWFEWERFRGIGDWRRFIKGRKPTAICTLDGNMLLPHLFSVLFFPFSANLPRPPCRTCVPPWWLHPSLLWGICKHLNCNSFADFVGFSFSYWEYMCQCLTWLLHNSGLLCNTRCVFVLPLYIHWSHWF